MSNVSASCKRVGISRKTFYDYYNTDEEFKREIDDLKEYCLDYAESKLFENIKNGRETSIIYYLNNRGKTRGYNNFDYTTSEVPKLSITLNGINEKAK